MTKWEKLAVKVLWNGAIVMVCVWLALQHFHQ